MNDPAAVVISLLLVVMTFVAMTMTPQRADRLRRLREIRAFAAEQAELELQAALTPNDRLWLQWHYDLANDRPSPRRQTDEAPYDRHGFGSLATKMDDQDIKLSRLLEQRQRHAEHTRMTSV